MLNGQNQVKQIAKTSKFHYSFNNFGRNPPQEYVHEFWGANLVCKYFRDVV